MEKKKKKKNINLSSAEFTYKGYISSLELSMYCSNGMMQAVLFYYKINAWTWEVIQSDPHQAPNIKGKTV